ncbi:MAG: Crp/Fnr family transcriptional regulator [Clostridia bacterium]|nr:Crp/Fnr family transcriptional regulator [Clostridia bacterium]
MKNNLSNSEISSIETCTLFKTLTRDEVIENISHIHYLKKNYKTNTALTHFNNGFKGVGILLSGKIRSYVLYSNGNELPLRYISPSEIFGLSSIFKPNADSLIHFMTDTPCTFVLIPEDSFLQLLQNSSTILHNYLYFTNQRINFLISKIALFNLSNNSQKIAQYLLFECDANASDNFKLSCSKAQLCEYLGMGRTSFYREINMLSKSKAIKVHNKNTITIDKKKLLKLLQQ